MTVKTKYAMRTLDQLTRVVSLIDTTRYLKLRDTYASYSIEIKADADLFLGTIILMIDRKAALDELRFEILLPFGIESEERALRICDAIDEINDHDPCFYHAVEDCDDEFYIMVGTKITNITHYSNEKIKLAIDDASSWITQRIAPVLYEKFFMEE